jgi:hypothetical protein
LAEAGARERRRQAEVEAGMAWVRERQARLAAERDEEQKRGEQERRAREEGEVRHRERQAQIAAQREAEERARAEAERERARVAAEQEAAMAAECARAATQAQPQPVEPPRSEPVPDALPTRRQRPDIAPWHSPSSSAPVSQTPWYQERDRDWKKAFAVAAGVVILVMLGIMAYGNRRPASPLSAGEVLRQNAIEQQSPFGPARLKPQASPARPAVAVPHAPPTAAQAAAAQRPSPRKPDPGRRRRLDTAAGEDKEWVDDEEVVVRHYSQRPQPDRKVASSNGVKRYSDLE